MDEASAAKLEELRLGAVSQGKEWLSRSLSEMSARQLRVLAAAGGVKSSQDSKLVSSYFRQRTTEPLLAL